MAAAIYIYIHHGRQVSGAGVHHPDSKSSNYVQPNGSGTTNAIERAELTAIAAACHARSAHITVCLTAMGANFHTTKDKFT
eukprot:1137997-Pelagomonas_calceolata.AAC.1